MTDVLYMGEMAEKWYDPLFTPDDGSLRMVSDFLKGRGCRSVIDVGCGTGRHSVMLSRKGYDVLGVDVSQDMIKKAVSKKSKADFVCSDMREMKTDRRFDAAIVMDSAFCYMVSNDDCIKALKNIRSVLNPNGVILIEDVNTWSHICSEALDRNYSAVEENGRVKIRVDSQIQLSPLDTMMTEQRVYNRIRKANESMIVARDERPVELRIFTPNQMDLLFRLSGFRTVGFYGDMKMRPFSEKNCETMISVAEKK